MKKGWKVCVVLVLVCVVPIVTYLIVMSIAMFTLEDKYGDMSDGLTIEETDNIMGFVFRARKIDWNDIPKIYTGHYVEEPGSVARDYRFLGISSLSIIVVYDAEGHSYLHIPIYE